MLIDDESISLLCSTARDASSTLLSGEVSSVIVVIVEVEVFTSVVSLDELVILEDLVLLLVVADFGTDADAFLLKKEKRFFCFGGGFVDFAIVVVVDIGTRTYSYSLES